MPSLKALRKRITTVRSTQQITKAMKMVAAAKLRRAQESAERARPYATKLTELFTAVAAGIEPEAHPLLARREERRVDLLVLSSDRGLCGGYNANVIRAAERALRAEVAQGREYSLVLVGRKAVSYFRYRHYRIDAAFEGMSDQPTYENARQVAQAVLTPFENGEVDQVQLVYTQFLSVGTQRVLVRRLMPLDTGALADTREGEATADYEYEPEPGEILARLLPRYVEARIYAAMLDAAASEHAARQRAMKAATDNAEDLIVRLTRAMNRARQDSITTEIMEIVGGAEALRKGKKPVEVSANAGYEEE